MNKFSYKNLLVLALSSVVLFSCSKDDDKSANPNNPDNPNNPSAQKCRITNENENNGEEESIYEYDNQRRLVKQLYKESGQLETYYDTYEYNNAGYVSKSIEWDGTTQEGYDLYTYNSDGRLTRRESYYDNGTGLVLDVIRTYEYDSNKRLIRKNYYEASAPTVIDEYSIYSYPSATTARETNYYDMNGDGTLELNSTTDYTFDDKKSPQLLLGIAYDDEFISEHNTTKEVHTYPNGQNPSRTYTYTYEYNAQGFPTKSTGNDGISTPWVKVISYNCN